MVPFRLRLINPTSVTAHIEALQQEPSHGLLLSEVGLTSGMQNSAVADFADYGIKVTGSLQIQGILIQGFCVVAGFSTPLSLIQGIQIQGFCACAGFSTPLI